MDKTRLKKINKATHLEQTLGKGLTSLCNGIHQSLPERHREILNRAQSRTLNTACSSKVAHLRCARMDNVQVHVTISNDAGARNNFN